MSPGDTTMRVAFRVDASTRIGSGHVVRCVTLANELRSRGAGVTFISREHEAGWYQRILDAGFELILLPTPTGSVPGGDGDYAAWLGVAQEQDAQESVEALGPGGVDLLIVDHYGLDAAWEERLRPHTRRMMAIDDLADRAHDVDVLLDQNLSMVGPSRYARLIPKAAQRLLGPEFALIDPVFRVARSLQVPPEQPHVPQVLVYFGASDQYGLTLAAVSAMLELGPDVVSVDAVVGPGVAEPDVLWELAAEHAHLRVWHQLPHLAGLMSRCDVAIGAGGSTSWERACLSMPTLMVTVAANQVAGAEALQAHGAARYLGPADAIGTTTIASATRALLDDQDTLAEMAKVGRELVDGAGVFRVAECLLPSDRAAAIVLPAQQMADAVQCARGQLGDPEPRALASFRVMLRELEIAKVTFEEDAAHDLVNATVDASLVDSCDVGAWVWMARAAHRQRSGAQLTGSGNRRVPIGYEAARRSSSTPIRRISVVSDADSWLNEHIPTLLETWLQDGHLVDWVHSAEQGSDADVCFYLSYGQIVPPSILSRHRLNLVVHASELPRGRGWSPMSWQVLEGASRVPVTLFEAVEALDAGPVYAQNWLGLDGYELIDELRQAQTAVAFGLCRWSVERLADLSSHAIPQEGEPTTYPRRRPADSRLDPDKSLTEQFDLLRIVDNERYPAFFDHRGCRYRLRIERVPSNERSAQP